MIVENPTVGNEVTQSQPANLLLFEFILSYCDLDSSPYLVQELDLKKIKMVMVTKQFSGSSLVSWVSNVYLITLSRME